MKLPKVSNKFKTKGKPVYRRGARSKLGRDPGVKKTVSSQLAITNYFGKKEGSPMGLDEVEDTK